MEFYGTLFILLQSGVATFEVMNDGKMYGYSEKYETLLYIKPNGSIVISDQLPVNRALLLQTTLSLSGLNVSFGPV